MMSKRIATRIRIGPQLVTQILKKPRFSILYMFISNPKQYIFIIIKKYID